MNRPFLEINGRVPPRAFTLVEMLVVLAILAILAVLVIPSLGPLMRSYALNSASSMITDELTYAHQAALTRNAAVEVRIYQTGSSANANDLQYRAIRSVLSASNQPLDKIKYLPSQVIISSNTNYSTLISTNSSANGISTNSEALPGGGVTNYISFQFRATGGTTLTPVTGTGSTWYLALFPENAYTNSAGMPNNYVTVQVDPVTGNVKTYRP